jgi:hypothetical protein
MRHVPSNVLPNEHEDRARQGQLIQGIDEYSSGAHFDGWADLSPRPLPDAERAPPITPEREGCDYYPLVRNVKRAGKTEAACLRPGCTEPLACEPGTSSGSMRP